MSAVGSKVPRLNVGLREKTRTIPSAILSQRRCARAGPGGQRCGCSRVSMLCVRPHQSLSLCQSLRRQLDLNERGMRLPCGDIRRGDGRRGDVAPRRWAGRPGAPVRPGFACHGAWGPGGGLGGGAWWRWVRTSRRRHVLSSCGLSLLTVCSYRSRCQSTPLALQRLTVCAATGVGSTPGQGTKIPRAMQCVRPEVKKAKRTDRP